jgi:adenosylcobinamide-phosphate synthase
MALLLPAASAGLAAAVPRLPLPAPIRFAVEIWLLKSTFAVRGLLDAAELVRGPLQMGHLSEARAALHALVSRDTSRLTEGLVAAAAIESLAGNSTDSALAPWLAYAVLGLPGAAAYRALNTLDSMIGYRGWYEYLGKAAARADDAANLLPARLAASLIAASAWFGAGSTAEALRKAFAYHSRTASPNAGWTMAAMAGALGVTLEKAGAYRLGDGPPPLPADIRRAQRIVAAALAIGAALCGALAIMFETGQQRHADARRRAPG